MVATLPGRTHGLGLITEPLLKHAQMERVPFAALNFWATLIGSAFCIPVGWAIDRFGVRVVLAAVLLALGAVVLGVTGVQPGSRPFTVLAPEFFFGSGVEWLGVPLDLLVLITLTRGLGQSALSVVSLALIGKVAGQKPGPAVGVYSFLVTFGFITAFGLVKVAFGNLHADWRTVWDAMGWVLIAFGAVALVFVRNPRAASEEPDAAGPAERSFTLREALLTPAFWVFALATSFYGLIAAGTSLFGQSLLAERGFDRDMFLTVTTVTPFIGLVANIGAGLCAQRVGMGYLLAASLFLQAAALACFPLVSTLWQVYTYALAMGVSGGVLTVVFFAVWRRAYGPEHLGKIQGFAQLLTVFASAAGPLILAVGHRALGSYALVFENFALVAVGFAVAALVVPFPKTTPQEDEQTW
jgi:MFS family permease